LLVLYIPAGLAFAAAIVILWIVPSKNLTHIPDEEFFSILMVFRAPHHYLASSFPALHYLSAATFVATSCLMIFQFKRHQRLDFPPLALALALAFVPILCIASFLFVDIAHNRVWAEAQVFRLLFLVKWVGFLFFAWSASRWLSERSLIGLASAIVPIVVTGDAQPFAMAAALFATANSRFLPHKSWGRPIPTLLLISVAIALGYAAGPAKDMGRAGVGIACAALVYAWSWRPAFALVAVLIAFGVVNRNREFVDFGIFRPTYSWADLKGPDIDIARWIKKNTPTNSVWVTPPDFESFRVIAERAMIADFTSVPFQEPAMREWRARLRALYGATKNNGFVALRSMDENYRKVKQATLEKAARDYGADFAVLYADTPWPGEVLYQNKRYKAVRIAPIDR
jgi:hypothetical protein